MAVANLNTGEGDTYADTTYTAKFVADETKTYKVTYTAENGTVDPEETAAIQVLSTEGVNGSTATGNAGYKFDGWYKGTTKISDATTLSAEVAVANLNTGEGDTYADTTYTAKFVADSDTKYTIIYYEENVDDDGFTESSKEEKAGKTGDTAKATPDSATGFYFDEENPENVIEGVIAGDGSLVLKVYYKRNTHTVTYAYNGTVPAGASALPAVATYKYGQKVTVAPAATAPGYTFSGWSTTGTFTIADGDVIISGSFTAIPAPDDDDDPTPTPTPGPVIIIPTPEPEPDPDPQPNPPVVPPVQPAAGPEPTIIEPDPVPAATPAPTPTATPGPTVIDQPKVPMAQPKYWALINLLSAIATTLIGLGMVITFFRKKKEDEEEEDEEKAKERNNNEEEEEDPNKRRPSKFLGLIPAIASIILFVLTENMKNPMRLTDKWTIWMVVIALVNVVLAYLTRNQKMGRLVFDANGGNGTMTSIVGEMGKDVTIANNAFTNDGYTFAGWNTKADGTGESYGDGDSWKMSEDKPNKLFAQWKH